MKTEKSSIADLAQRARNSVRYGTDKVWYLQFDDGADDKWWESSTRPNEPADTLFVVRELRNEFRLSWEDAIEVAGFLSEHPDDPASFKAPNGDAINTA